MKPTTSSDHAAGISSSITSAQKDWVAKIRKATADFQSLSDPQLVRVVEDLRESVHQPQLRNETEKHLALAIPAIAAANEGLRRVVGYNLYDVQLLAADTLIQRKIAEMQTGEGKTISALPAAVYGGILGIGTHIATPNAYLAKRDWQQLHDVFQSLGLTAGLLDTEDPNCSKAKAYACDVTYGPGYEFGFDYLRDQMLLKQNASMPRGARQLKTLRGETIQHPVQVRGLGYSIIDEIDNVLIDDASSPQVLSEFQPGNATDEEAVLMAKRIAGQLQPESHFREPTPGQFELTPMGLDEIHKPELAIPVDQLIRPWSQYVEAALRARLFFLKDVDYVVVDDAVRIIEKSTGRIFEDRSWQSGIHQAVEAKESVPITPESLPLAKITRQRFYGLYSQLAGMTGTAHVCRSEFKQIYHLDVMPIPLRLPSQRETLPIQVIENPEKKWEAISESVRKFHQQRRPVLVGTRTVQDSNVLAEYLEQTGLPFVKLNGLQDAEESEVIARAGEAGAITIATNLAGRGTDIKLAPGVNEEGGLHVIVSDCHASSRVDRQLVGRCARQGNRGSTQTFVSPDDWLFVNHAPWFSEMLRSVVGHNHQNVDIESKIRSIQLGVERIEFAKRLQLLQSNSRLNKILTGAGK